MLVGLNLSCMHLLPDMRLTEVTQCKEIVIMSLLISGIDGTYLAYGLYKASTNPSGHLVTNMSYQRRRIDVDTTSFLSHVPAGILS